MNNTEQVLRIASATLWGTPRDARNAIDIADKAHVRLVDVLHARLLLKAGVVFETADFLGRREPRWAVRRLGDS